MTSTLNTVAALTHAEFTSRLCKGGLGLQFGPFAMHLEVPLPDLASILYPLYRDYAVLDGPQVYSCHFVMRPVRQHRWPPRRMVRVTVDGRSAQEDMPIEHALPALEWGLNLVVVMRHQAYLMLHAAALERGGHGLLLPASPGHGKTTLCAALAHRGWRFLSDEFGLVRQHAIEVLPIPRPMPLKNESIDVMRSFAPDAWLGPSIPGTRKGTVAHVRPPSESIRASERPASVRWIVFPRWEAGAGLTLEPVSKAQAFLELATHAFNYESLGFAGFETVKGLIERSSCWRLQYSNLDDAVRVLQDLSSQPVR